MSEPVNYYSPLSVEECWSLLASIDVGRVAFVSDEGITVVPVNYAVVDGRVAFHTREGAKLARLAEPTDVAFEADDIDFETAIGWSVMLRGRTSGIDTAPKTSWLVGRDAVGIAIAPSTISGRVVSGERK